MKHYIKKLLIASCVLGLTLTTVLWAYAMNDEQFKNTILEQLKLSHDFSQEELQDIKKELEDISRDDILESLEEEISYVVDTDLQKSLREEYDKLNQITDGGEFFELIDAIYKELDDYYWENDEAWEDAYEYDFSDEKNQIFDALLEEAEFIDDDDIQVKVQDFVEQYNDIQDEDLFFDQLDALYSEIDSYYGYDDDEDWWDVMEIDFDMLRSDILEWLLEEKKFIKDENIQKKIDILYDSLKDEDDEDMFFNLMDEFYMDPDLESYYEWEGIEIISGEDFFWDDFDFENEKSMILELLREEIQYIDDQDLKKLVTQALEELRRETNETQFFDILDTTYNQIDDYYEEYGFPELDDEYLFDTSEEIFEFPENSENLDTDFFYEMEEQYVDFEEDDR